MILAVAAMLVPSLASYVHTPAAPHERALSVIASVVLLIVFALSLPSLDSQGRATSVRRQAERGTGSAGRCRLRSATLAVTGVARGVRLRLVRRLRSTPALDTLHISQAFAGLVIVAIAGNAVENVVGHPAGGAQPGRHRAVGHPQLAAADRAGARAGARAALPADRRRDVHAGASRRCWSRPWSPSVLAVSFVIIDGESDWLEGAALLGLYAVIAASFWWG